MKDNRREILVFIVKYLSFLLLFLLLVGVESLRKVLDVNGLYTAFTVKILVFVLNLVGLKASCHGTVLSLNGFKMNVLFGCNGLEAFFIYAAGVLAFRASVKMKILGMLVGLCIIQFINLVRLFALAIVGAFFSSYFDYFHIYVAQGIMIAVALGVFMIYLSRVNAAEKLS